MGTFRSTLTMGCGLVWGHSTFTKSQIYPAVIKPGGKYRGAWTAGVLLTGFLAPLISTLNAQTRIMQSVITENGYKWPPSSALKEKLRQAKNSIIAEAENDTGKIFEPIGVKSEERPSDSYKSFSSTGNQEGQHIDENKGSFKSVNSWENTSGNAEQVKDKPATAQPLSTLPEKRQYKTWDDIQK